MPTPPLAFGLLNLPILGWLAVAAAPLLIHLLTRQKFKSINWAAMEYLLAAFRRQSRRLRLEQWLLLALRTLLIILAVLAASEPFRQRSSLMLSSEGAALRILVLDGSYSMQYQPDGESRWEAARRQARQLVEQSSPGDAFMVMVMASPPRWIVSKPSDRRGEILRELDAVAPEATDFDLTATMKLLDQAIRRARNEYPQWPKREIYFLTDLHRHGWLMKDAGVAREEFLRMAKSVGASATFIALHFDAAAAENLAVTSLRTLDAVALAGDEAVFEAEVRNFGATSKSKVLVEFLVNGHRIGEQKIDVPAGGAATATFAQRFFAAGDQAIEARIPRDALERDNRRYFTLPVRESLRIACVDGRPSSEPFQNATDYLVRALVPQKSASGRARLQVEVLSESALLEQDLTRCDVLFLCDVAQFTAKEAKLLRTYLDKGGNVVFFLGDQVRAERYDRELFDEAGSPSNDSAAGKDAEKTPLRILPARIGPALEFGAQSIDPLEFKHPIVRSFRGRGETALLKSPIGKYHQLQIPKESDARAVLSTSDGDPLIVEGACGRGRVVLVATGADATWSPLPLWPSFLPLVQEITAFCLRNDFQQQNVAVGEPLIATATWRGDRSLKIQTPDEKMAPLTLTESGPASSASYGETGQPGFYRIFGENAEKPLAIFAVNIDTAESNLTSLSESELRSQVMAGVPISCQSTLNLELSPTAEGAIVRTAGMQVDLLYGVLLLVFVETFAAWRFGHFSG